MKIDKRFRDNSSKSTGSIVPECGEAIPLAGKKGGFIGDRVIQGRHLAESLSKEGNQL